MKIFENNSETSLFYNLQLVILLPRISNSKTSVVRHKGSFVFVCVLMPCGGVFLDKRFILCRIILKLQGTASSIYSINVRMMMYCHENNAHKRLIKKNWKLEILHMIHATIITLLFLPHTISIYQTSRKNTPT